MVTASRFGDPQVHAAPAVSHSDMAEVKIATLIEPIAFTSDTPPSPTNVSIPGSAIAETPSRPISISQADPTKGLSHDLLTPIKYKTSTSIRLTSFTLYSKLPLELRNKIIHHCIPHFPRIIQVGSNDTSPYEYIYDVIASSTNPLLQVNGDFRNEVGRYYTAPFIFFSGSGRDVDVKKLRVNWEIDTLFIRRVAVPISLMHEDLSVLDTLFVILFGTNFEQVKNHLCKLAGSVFSHRGFWNRVVGPIHLMQTMQDPFRKFEIFDGFLKLEEVVLVGPNTPEYNKLLRFEDMIAPPPLYWAQVEWHGKGFNRAKNENGDKVKRVKTVVIRMCHYYGTMDKEAEEMMGVES
ncbi:hypothetical protein WAI453_001900 [Rhynchosporium graminicola]|uniref:2EXR domain-containing protein n=1 Tax=Rhynchosporium graminicola TaxID=2792576 RepID=A0A1E1KKX5_9HELO|nr:uncharacterized protein RCO7_06402 [Rhynchosporium commune]